MNDTIDTPRKQYLLNLINESDGLIREALQEKVSRIYPVSKITLIRDLNSLIKKGLVRSVGKAKATRYVPTTQNPLHRSFNVDLYFSIEPDRRSVAGKAFDFSIFNLLNNLFTNSEQEVLGGSQRSFSQSTTKLSEDVLKKEIERFLIELSWKSSKIEGNTYSLLETETLIKEKVEAEGKTREEAVMILNHKEAFEQILKSKEGFKKLTVSGINELHNTLVKNLGITTGIRKQAVGITGTAYTPLDNEFQIEEAQSKMVNLINSTENPNEKALIAYVMIPYIQPFSDGNKRTARMLVNAILLAWDLFPLSYRSIDVEEFKKALILFYEQKSIVYLKKLFIDQVMFANKNYFK